MKKSISVRAIKKAVKSDRANILRLMKQLVGIPTVNPPGINYRKMVDFLGSEGKKLGLSVKKINAPVKYTKQLPPEAKGERWNIILGWKTGSKKKLHFNGHFDVVPASGGFKADPFKLRVQGNKLLGRGAGDMKCSITACFAAVKVLKKLGIKPAWDLEFSFCCDEETGGLCGTGMLVKEGLIKADAAVETDGSGGTKLTIAHRGIYELIVTVLGKSAHAATHTDGVNAFLKGIEIVTKIEEYRKKLEKRASGYSADKRIKRIATLMVGGRAYGGVKGNAVPDRFAFTVDRRILPEENLKKVRSELLALIQHEAKRLGVKVKIEEEMLPPSAIKSDSPIAKTFAGAIKKVFEKPAFISMTGGRLDMEYLINGAKIPTLAYGVSGKNFHGDEESTDIRDIIDTAAVYAEVMRS